SPAASRIDQSGGSVGDSPGAMLDASQAHSSRQANTAALTSPVQRFRGAGSVAVGLPKISGGGGIRTHGSLATSAVFKIEADVAPSGTDLHLFGKRDGRTHAAAG